MRNNSDSQTRISPQEAERLRTLLAELQYHGQDAKTITIHGDNQGALSLAENPESQSIQLLLSKVVKRLSAVKRKKTSDGDIRQYLHPNSARREFARHQAVSSR
jgi:hypothetical protein